MNLKALVARATIGTMVLRKIFMQLLRLWRPGPRPWLRRLARERLAPNASGTWSYVHETSACIGCGLCDVVARGVEPARWIVSVARQPEDAPLALDAAARLRQLSEGVARICPARVSAASIARLIEDNARVLGELEREDGA